MSKTNRRKITNIIPKKIMNGSEKLTYRTDWDPDKLLTDNTAISYECPSCGAELLLRWGCMLGNCDESHDLNLSMIPGEGNCPICAPEDIHCDGFIESIAVMNQHYFDIETEEVEDDDEEDIPEDNILVN